MSIVYDMPFKDYQAAEGVNCSALKEIDISPENFKYALEHPRKKTPSMMFGSALHHKMLEPHMPPPYAVRPHGQSPHTNEGKAWKASMLEAGRDILDEDDIERVEACKQSILRHPKMVEVMENCKTEVSIFGEHCGVKVKCRIDVLCNTGALFDFKTCDDARPRFFKKQARELLYDVQGNFYRDLYNAERGDLPEATGFWFFAVESKPPHGVQMHSMTYADFEGAQRKLDELWETYFNCTATGIWPGYSPEISPLNIQRWQPSRDLF